MKRFLLTLGGACAAILGQSAQATTFPTLTTIYVAAGVYDNGAADGAGVATTVLCSNVSGQTATIRFLFLVSSGQIGGQYQESVPHGVTLTVSTHATDFIEQPLTMPGVGQGVLNVESTQSGVFCTALIVDATSPANSAPLHIVRVNPHPGTVE
jgi:hypothetical protein